MYQLTATRVLYQTSKYAAVAVLRLDITVPGEIDTREQISAGLDRIGGGRSGSLLAPAGEASAIGIYCDLVLGLQHHAGHKAQYCHVQELDTSLEYRVFVEYEEEASALYAVHLTTELLNGVLEQQHISELQQLLNEFEVYARPRVLDSNARVLIRAAGRRDIPVIRPLLPRSLYASVEEMQNGEYQLGWGVNQQRCNGAVSEKLVPLEIMPQVLDRAQLHLRLINASIPMPVQDSEFINRNQARRAQRSARRIGYPVILRPRASRLFQYRFAEDYVFGPLHNDDQVGHAAKYLSQTLRLDVWIESFVCGDLYRFLVINGEVLSVVRCTPPVITGDGVQSIAELAGDLGDADVRFRLQLFDFEMNSVLEPGFQLALRGSGSLKNGGGCENVTTEMPARFKELAARVAEQCDLGGLAGIDLIIENLSRQAVFPNCAASNVVLDPDLHMFEQLSDQPDRIGEGYLAALFPDGTPSRIPIVSITGTNGKTTTSRMVAHILRTAGMKTGMTCTDGVYLHEQLLMKGDSSGVSGAISVLVEADMEAAVLETARGGLATGGIAFDHCDIGVCLNVANDHLGQEGIETVDDMAIHKRQVIERTTGTVVLNAEDQRCLAMREHTTAKEVLLVASSSGHPVIKAHCEAGGKAIAVEVISGIPMIVLLAPGGELTPVMAVNDIPATFGGAAHHNVLNAMFAIAISSGFGIEQNHILSGLSTFRTSVETTPGRLNEVAGFPFRVIIDVAHNAHSFIALVEFCNRLPVQGKKIINFGFRGGSSDEDIQEIARIVAGNFDLYILKNYRMDLNWVLSNRTLEEVPEILKMELLHQGVSGENIIVELDFLDSLDRSLESAQKDDLLIVQAWIMGNGKLEAAKKLKAAAKDFEIML